MITTRARPLFTGRITSILLVRGASARPRALPCLREHTSCPLTDRTSLLWVSGVAKGCVRWWCCPYWARWDGGGPRRTVTGYRGGHGGARSVHVAAERHRHEPLLRHHRPVHCSYVLTAPPRFPSSSPPLSAYHPPLYLSSPVCIPSPVCLPRVSGISQSSFVVAAVITTPASRVVAPTAAMPFVLENSSP